MDRLFTSFEVPDWLLKRNVTMIGTIMSNRVGIPPEIKPVTNREENSYLLFWRKDGLCNISTYVPKTAKGKENVMVVSMVQSLIGVTKDEKTKPAVIKLYDFKKNGCLNDKIKVEEMNKSFFLLFVGYHPCQRVNSVCSCQQSCTHQSKFVRLRCSISRRIDQALHQRFFNQWSYIEHSAQDDTLHS